MLFIEDATITVARNGIMVTFKDGTVKYFLGLAGKGGKNCCINMRSRLPIANGRTNMQHTGLESCGGAAAIHM
jgi:hypothetical protein